MVKSFGIILIAVIFLEGSLYPTLAYPFERGPFKVESWKMHRDKGIAKQQKDDTCGAAVLATILQLYGASITEGEILNETGKQGWISFEDIRQSAIKRGYQAVGYGGDLDLLGRLQLPAIIFLVPEKGREHFSIVYKIDDERVYLADPAWGHTRMGLSRFKKLWQTRSGEYYGRFLMVFPKADQPILNMWPAPSPFYGNVAAIKDVVLFRKHVKPYLGE